MSKLILIFTLVALSSVAFAEKTEVTLSIRKGMQPDKQKLQQLLKNPLILSAKSLFTSNEQTILNKMNASYLGQTQVLVVRNKDAVKELRRQVRDSGLPVYIDSNEMKIKAQAVDPLFEKQWGLLNKGVEQHIDLDPVKTYRVPARPGEDLGLASVKSVQAAKKVLIAVLDTGIQRDHPDLISSIHKNPSECAALEKFLACTQDKERAECEKTWFDLNNPEVDQDKNGYPLDCSGWSLLGGMNAAKIVGRPDFADSHGHGTHVAGIIAATGGNGIGIHGVSNNVKILPVQVIGGGPSEPIKPLSIINPDDEKLPKAKRESFLADMVARGVIYAINSGAQVINFSMGWPQSEDSQFMRQIIMEAQSRGIVIVAAAGNDSTKALLRPCAYSGVICVASNGPDGALSHFSNYGSGADIAAPGTNILSTIPTDNRPIRTREKGYDFLSGTSQASPYVAGLVAEMLVRGMPSAEAYSRLILGARALQKPMAFTEGAPHVGSQSKGELLASPIDQNKYVLSGNADLAKSLKVAEQALILPASKERTEIRWNRQDAVLIWTIPFKNFWKSVDMSDVRISGAVVKSAKNSIRPVLSKIEIENLGPIWQEGQVRNVRFELSITDAEPLNSRISSDLELAVKIETPESKRQAIIEAEITVPIGPAIDAPDITKLPIAGIPKAQTTFIPVDEKLDGKLNMDYLISTYDQKSWSYWLMSQTTQSYSSPYQVNGPLKVKPITKSIEDVRENVWRVDQDEDGVSEYILGLYHDRSEDTDTEEEFPSSPMTFVVFSNKLENLETFTYDSKISQIPYADGIKWAKMGAKRRPVWLGPGTDPEKKKDLWDLWQELNGMSNGQEESEIRLYFLNENNEIKALKEHGDYRIVDILTPTTKEAQKGIVPILLAKNKGTDLQPSYLYDFAVAQFINGEIQEFHQIDLFADGQTYRNLLDTRVDRVLSLDFVDEVAKGTFWFSEGKSKEQRLSYLTHENYKFFDYSMKSIRPVIDAALWVRMVFAGSSLSGAFVLTNSEVQYHDLATGDVAVKSLERYSFFPKDIFINVQEPLVVHDKKLNTKVPALFTAEGTGLNKGLRITLPVYDQSKKLLELIVPARLRFRSESGCKPLDTPVWGGSQSAAAVDYLCRDRDGDQILRVNLSY